MPANLLDDHELVLAVGVGHQQPSYSWDGWTQNGNQHSIHSIPMKPCRVQQLMESVQAH